MTSETGKKIGGKKARKKIGGKQEGMQEGRKRREV